MVSGEESRPAPIGRREAWALAATLLFALALRVAYTLSITDNPYFHEPAVDQGFWVEWGRAIAAGEVRAEGPFARAPLYAYSLGAVFSLFGDSLLLARLLQDCLGTLAVALVYLIGRRLFDPRAALLGALLAASSWVLIYYDNEFLRAGPSAPVILLALWLCLRLDERPGSARALATGLAFGVAALLRTQIVAFVPVVGVWLIREHGWRNSRRELLALLIGLSLPILPVTAFNLFVGGELVLISPEAGTVLWNGNHPAADGVTSVPPGVRGGFREHLRDQHTQAERALGRSLAASQSSRYWLRRTLETAREDPLRELGLLARKSAMFWSDWEYGNPEEPLFFARRFAPWTRGLFVGFGLLAGLAAIGAGASLHQRRRAAALLSAFVLVYMATVVLFLVGSRYRAPVLPVLAIFAGGGLSLLIEELRARRLVRVAAWIGLLAVVWFGARSQPAPRDASRANGLWWLGLAEARAGHPELALELYDQALDLRDDFAYLHAARARALIALGSSDQARAGLERALELDSVDPVSLDTLAALERQAGRLDRARTLAMRSIERDPNRPDPWFTLGRIEYTMGQAGAAFAAFERAYESDPEHFNAAFSFGVMALERGRREQGIEALERVLESNRGVSEEVLRRARAALEEAR